jgi:hypothetical protein
MMLMHQLMLVLYHASMIFQHKSLIHHHLEVLKVSGLQSIGQSIGVNYTGYHGLPITAQNSKI